MGSRERGTSGGGSRPAHGLGLVLRQTLLLGLAV